MKAVSVSDPGTVALVDAPEPRAAAGEAVITVDYVAVCATDKKLVTRGARPARVPGHEIAGRLDDGSLVGVHPDIGCGECAFCRAGFENRCPGRVSIGLDRDGGFAQMVAVPKSHLIKLDIAPELGPLLEPLACCVHAASMLGVERGDRAVVVGAGPMGVLAMWTLQACGVEVLVVQRSKERRRLAAELGAAAALGPEERVEDHTTSLPRFAIVTAPGPDALQWALKSVSVGGAIHVFAGSPDEARVDANVIHYRHLSLMGSSGSNLSDYQQALNFVKDDLVPIRKLPTATITLNELPGALRGEYSSHALKIVVDLGR